MAGLLFDRFVEGAVATSPFSDEAVLSAMLRFEIALCRAQAAVGLVPSAVAESLVARMGRATFDADAIARDGTHAGSVAIPFVKALTGHVAASDPDAARWVHFGATSQDVIDTAMVLCAKDALRDLDRPLTAMIRSAIALAERTMAVPVLARTLMQPAGVTTVGYRAAQWAAALTRCRRRLRSSAETALAVSLGGAVGDLAVLGREGDAVRAELALRLGLADPGGARHALRDDWIAFHATLGPLAGVMRKIAGDIARSAQFEIGEMSEPEAHGRGGSTAMPHKRNPVLSLRVLAATQLVPGWLGTLMAGGDLEFERSLATWQAELGLVPPVWSRMQGAADALSSLLDGLEIDEARCRANIDALRGLVFADRLAALWAPVIGKAGAQATVEALCRRCRAEDVRLQDLAQAAGAADPRLLDVPDDRLRQCFDLGLAADASMRQGRRIVHALKEADDTPV